MCPVEAKLFPGYPNYYASYDGRVWSEKNKKFLEPRYNMKGYFQVRLYKKGLSKGKRFLVHRIIAISWIPNPENKPIVNHSDEYIFNNAVPNLCWMTEMENREYSRLMKLKRAEELNKEVPF